MRKYILIYLFGALSQAFLSHAADPLVFIAAFAGGDDGNGAIHAYRLNSNTGELKLLHRTLDVKHPFFMAVSPNRKFLYTIHAKEFNGKETEQVAAYAIDRSSGRLSLLNRQSTSGIASCYLEVDATGSTLLLANYTTGSVVAFPIREDGSLDKAASFVQHTGSSVDPERQTGPKAHSIIVSPDNRFAYAADLGIDKIMNYKFDPTNAILTPNSQPFVQTSAGAGPRHLIFHPNGKQLYVINELSDSISLFDQSTHTGTLTLVQTVSTLPDAFEGRNHCADLKITPDGKFLYGTNRGHDSIAIFSLAVDGRLTRVGIESSLGKNPQNLLITPEGDLLLCANMLGDNVSVFHLDKNNGLLTSAGKPVAIPQPSCIRFLPN